MTKLKDLPIQMGKRMRPNLDHLADDSEEEFLDDPNYKRKKKTPKDKKSNQSQESEKNNDVFIDSDS